MSNFVGFKSPRSQHGAAPSAATTSTAATLINFAPTSHGASDEYAHAHNDHTVIHMPMLADTSDGRSNRIGIGHGAATNINGNINGNINNAELSPAMMDDLTTPTPVLMEEDAVGANNNHSITANKNNANNLARAKTTSLRHHHLHGHSVRDTDVSTSASAAPLRGDEPVVPRVFLSYAYAHNSFFARRLLRVSCALTTLMVAGAGIYYAYRPASIVLDPAYPESHGFFLRDPVRVYTLQATSCENMVGFSALVYHGFPIVVLLGMPGSGVRFFEPFQRQPLHDADGNRNTIKRRLVFQFCELMAVGMLGFAMLVFVFFWYMFFNGAAFSCGTLRVHAFALLAMVCYAGIFVQLVGFARFREHIKMQLGAFKESDQTGNVRKHLVDLAAAELLTKDDHVMAVIRKRLYKATSLGDLREMQTVLELARTKKLDQKGFPMKFYGPAKLYLRYFGVSQKNPVHVAAYNGNLEALELLHAHGFEIHTLDKFSRVRFSTGDLFWYFAHYLVSKPVTSDEDDAVSVFKTTLVTPLHCAVSTGQLEAVRWLIARGAEVGTVAQSSYRSERIPPIFLAETPAVVRELLENGATHLAIPDPGHMNTLTALQLAYLRGNFSVAQELEEWGCDVALTPFHAAAAMNDTNRVRKFIRRGTNINCLGEHGYRGMNRRTPLHWAAVAGADETVELLLEAGADPNFQDARGRTALHWAARLNKLEIVKCLLAKGALPNVADVDQMTPLACAASARHATRELFSVLVGAGADISYQLPTTGDTALHIAVREENQESALALLACGANLMKVNLDGLRPLDCSTDTKLLFAIKRAAGHRDVMISYTHSHAEFAKKLRKSLEDANVTTWLDLMDPSGIGGGSVWREEIARGITHAALVVCILTEDYAQSEWCLKELALAKQVGTPILAVSTEGIRIGEELQVYLYTRQIIPFEPCITETKRNAENSRQIEYEYIESKYKAQFHLLLDGVRDEIEKRRNDTIVKARRRHADGPNGHDASMVSTGFSKMFQPWDAPGAQQFVFVSHGDRHAQFVQRLCQELKSRDIAFYGDRNVEGQTFDERIHYAKEAILKCTCFIVVLSRDTMRSELVRDQLAFAEDKGRPIFPVVLNDVEIGFDKRYSLARTEFFHFLNDGFAFASSFNYLVAALQRHYAEQAAETSGAVIENNASSIASVVRQLPSSVVGLGHGGLLTTATSTTGSGGSGGASSSSSFANTSFLSNSSFASFLQPGPPPPSQPPAFATAMSSSSANSSFISDDSDGDPVMGKRRMSATPYLPAPRDPVTTTTASVIHEGDEPREQQYAMADALRSHSSSSSSSLSFSSIEPLDSIRNLDSISSLGSEDRQHLDLIRM